ncbi:MAG: recombinase family protein [Oscillospiraceae bacterium]|nr:recombinase family protein [Oscillospiraceae bacterium]
MPAKPATAKPAAGKAALYIRVSTDAQREEGYSIDAQKQMLEAHCVSRGIREYEFYIDGGFTGSNIDRPELQRLLNDARTGAIGCVVVYRLDRLSRSQKDTLYIIEDVLNPHKVDFTSINEHMDTATPMGRLMLGILSAFAQLERENIRERTRMGMTERVRNGLWMGGGRTPFGYDYDPEKGVLIPNQDADTVRNIYALYIKGYSLNRIAKMVGLKYEKLAYQILTRKSNAGFICYNGREYTGRHEPLVSLETYEQAMECLRSRSVKRLSGSDYLLTGLLRCGTCGARMRYQKWGKTGCKIVCYSRDKSKPSLVRDPDCRNVRLWAGDVEDVVVRDLFRFCVGKSKDEASAAPEQSVTDILREQYAAVSAKVKRLYTLYASSPDPLLLETVGEYQRELSNIMKQITAETERGAVSKRILTLRTSIDSIADVWDVLTKAERQDIVRTLISRVTVINGNITIDYVF